MHIILSGRKPGVAKRIALYRLIDLIAIHEKTDTKLPNVDNLIGDLPEIFR